MLRKIFKTDKYLIFPFILVLICVFVCFRNYTPGTYLTGWDTLHPEFNYQIYWKRILSGVWQSHQGLGSPASQAHASEIPRVLVIGVLDIFFATSFIRYLFAFLMLILGPLGVFYFLKRIIFRDSDDISSNLGSFLGGLFYLLNLGTLQHFNVPLEMFLVQYAFLGWIFLFLTRFYYEGRRKDLLWFVLITFLGAPQAHTPTLFYVYILSLFIYLVSLLVLGKFIKRDESKMPAHGNLKRAFIVFSLSLLINSFWLLPNLYYGVVKGKEVPLSKIHHLFSEEAFLVNKKYGNIKDISILKGFLFDWGVYSGGNDYSPLLGYWSLHLKNPLVSVIGYFFSFLILLGAVISVIKKDVRAIPWILVGFISVFFILNVNPPFGGIFVFFQENIPLFKELFRFPFTKFSIILMFVYAVFFGYSTSFLISIVKKSYLKLPLFLTIFISIIFFSLPAFKGYLINPAVRVEIPNRYFEMFDYFEKQDEYGRVLNLPIHSFWGWATYSWDKRGLGYQGAGFLWFGIKQPLIDREFDRWNIANEQPYREISTAIYSQNEDLLQKYLEKYDIRWLIFDKSVLAPGLDEKVLFHNEIEKMFSDMGSMSLDRDFGDGLLVYKFNPKEEYQRERWLDSYVESNNTLFKEYFDPIYTVYGDYISGGSETHQFVGFNSVDENLSGDLVYSDDKAVYFKLPYGDNNISDMKSIPVSLFLGKSDETFYIDVSFDGNSIGTIPVNFDRDGFYFLKFGDEFYTLNNLDNGFIGNSMVYLDADTSYEIYTTGKKIQIDGDLYSNLENCDPLGLGQYSSYSLSRLGSGFRVSAKNTLACVTSSATTFLDPLYRGAIAVSFMSNTPSSDQDFCMLDNKLGICVDHMVGNSYSVSDIELGAERYDLRFFVDARNAGIEVEKEYSNIEIDLLEKILEGSVVYDLGRDINMKGYLAFAKKDYLTIQPEEIEGNRRVCKQGQALNDSNFMDTGSGVVFSSGENSLCDSYSFPLASHKSGYVLEISADFMEGVPMRFCLTNEYSKRCDIEVALPYSSTEDTFYYLIPPMGDGVGYTVNISNYVFGNTVSKNELKYLSLVPISYESLKEIKSAEPRVGDRDVFVLEEAYDPGWVAFCGPFPCKADHVKVDNWSNGWVFENGQKDNVKVVFLPQYLEYIGFLLWIPILVFAFKYNKK